MSKRKCVDCVYKRQGQWAKTKIKADRYCSHDDIYGHNIEEAIARGTHSIWCPLSSVITVSKKGEVVNENER